MNAHLVAELEAYDLWHAAFERCCRAEDYRDMTLRDIGRYVSSRNENLHLLVSVVVDDVHRHEADVYELKAAKTELAELWQKARESRGANSPK